MFRRQGVEHPAAADGPHGRSAADHDAIVPDAGHRRFEPQLDRRHLTRQKFIPVQQNNVAEKFTGAGIDTHRRPVFQGLAVAFQVFEMDVQHITWRQRSGRAQDITPKNRLFVDPLKIYRRPYPGFGLVNLLTVNLKAAYLGLNIRGINLDDFAAFYFSGN